MSVSTHEQRRRRRQLMELAGRGAIIIVPAAPERIRNNDAHYPYRQDSDLVYLTGFEEPESVLVLVPGREAAESILFCRDRDRAREQWDGPRLGPEQAPAQLLVDDAFPIADIDDILPGLIEGRERVYYHFGRDSEFDLRVLGWINRVRAEVRRGARAAASAVARSSPASTNAAPATASGSSVGGAGGGSAGAWTWLATDCTASSNWRSCSDRRARSIVFSLASTSSRLPERTSERLA